jgi:hypothetical protein
MAEHHYQPNMDPLPRRMARQKRRPPWQEPTVQTPSPPTPSPVPHPIPVRITSAVLSDYPRTVVLSNSGDTLRPRENPHQLENWISYNAARIHTQSAHRQLHQRTGQRSIHDYFPPSPNFHPHSSDFVPHCGTLLAHPSLTAPLTCEPGKVISFGTCARR